MESSSWYHSVLSVKGTTINHGTVELFITGNELLKPGEKPKGVHIVDSNSVMLSPMIARDGGILKKTIHLPDERENSNYGYTEIKDHDFSKEIPMLLDKGDVLIFHSFLMHKSYDNKSRERRTAMVYHFAETGTNFGEVDSPTNEWISVRGKGLVHE